MTDERFELDLTADDLRAREAVRALARPQADARFCASLRERFVNGSIDAEPRPTVRRSSPAPLPMWRKLAPIAVGVAALILLIVPYVRTPGLNLLGIRGANQVVLNGEVVACGDLNPIRAALLPGCRIQAPEGAVMQFAREGELLMDLEGMEFTFPGPPLPLVGRAMHSSVQGDGTIRMATAPGFAGRSYRLRVGDADLVIRDTVFTVSRTGDEIGINVLEGQLEAVMPDGRTEMVGPRSGAMIKSGEFMKAEFDLDEAELLQTLRDRAVVI